MQYVACGRGDPTPSHCLQCSGVQVKWVKHMVYLGVVLTPQNSARDEVNKRTAGAAQTHRQLQRFVFSNPEIREATNCVPDDGAPSSFLQHASSTSAQVRPASARLLVPHQSLVDSGYQMGREDHQSGGPATGHSHAGQPLCPPSTQLCHISGCVLLATLLTTTGYIARNAVHSRGSEKTAWKALHKVVAGCHPKRHPTSGIPKTIRRRSFHVRTEER